MIREVALLAVAAAALVGCDAGPGARDAATPPRAVTASAVPGGPGWTDSGVEGTAPAAHSCHARRAPDGSPLPDPVCTPGAIDRSVPVDLAASDVPALASVDRVPPPEIRVAAETAVFAAYGVPADRRSAYALDTLIPVALGGSWNYLNLWPVPVPTSFAPNTSFRNFKDVTTVYLRDAAVRGLASLPAIQNALRHDWATAVHTLHLPAIPRSYWQGG